MPSADIITMGSSMLPENSLKPAQNQIISRTVFMGDIAEKICRCI